MKIKSILSAIFIALFLTSCNIKDEVSSITPFDNASKNFWERNHLAFYQLKGLVKTLTCVDASDSYNGVMTYTYQFNKMGFVTSAKTSTTSTNSNNIIVLSYNSNNQIEKIVESHSNDAGSSTDTTIIEYGTHGKYVPGSSIIQNDLTLNLKSRIGKYYRKDYIFNGEDLMIINTPANLNGKKDTTFVKYSGKYPISIKSKYTDITDITYTSNGMYKSYNTRDLLNNRPVIGVTFQQDADYLLIQTDPDTKGVITYNEHKDVIKRKSDDIENIYVYDSRGNWTSSKFNYYSNSLMRGLRTIEYW